jgi:hypothetical protein
VIYRIYLIKIKDFKINPFSYTRQDNLSPNKGILKSNEIGGSHFIWGLM